MRARRQKRWDAQMRSFTISVSALLALTAPVCAEQAIGSASLIEKTVEGLTADRSMRLKTGDAVYLNELLTTGQEAKGKFHFDDRATLQMGPHSQVRLDNFVYANAPAVAFNVTKGAFRFMSAGANHQPYEVRTNNATIGVRGTTFAVRSTELRTDAVLYEGAIEVCLPNGGQCRTLDAPCTVVAVTTAGFTETRKFGATDWSFDDACRPNPAPRPEPRHRQGAADPPASAPPPMTSRRMASTPPAPRKVQMARAEPPRLERVRPRPVRIIDARPEPVRSRWPRRPPHPPVYDDRGPEYGYDDPPPRVVRVPPVIFHPPFGGGRPFPPRYPGGGWGGGHFPMGPRGDGGGYNGGPISRWGRF